RARVADFRVDADRQSPARGTVTQQVMLIHLLACQVRHRHRIGARRCRLAIAQQLAGIATGIVGALEELAETTGAQLHLAAALLALQYRAIVTLDAELTVSTR